MSDADGDSTMLSDHSSVDEAFESGSPEPSAQPNITSNPSNSGAPRTPSHFPATELSPPSSQGVPTAATAAVPPTSSTFAFNPASAGGSGVASRAVADGLLPDSPPGSSAGLNANGKRVHSSAMGAGAEVDVPATGGSAEAVSGGESIGKASSGYEWQRVEDEPGYGWRNKKAVEEYHRAMEQIVDKQLMVKNRYGDPCLQGK